jgi:hypothetical protein
MTKTTKSKTATATKTVAAFVVSNGSQIDLADISTTTLDALVDQMVLAAQGAYGANIRIAAKLNELMAFDWFDVEYQEVSDNAKALKPHKAAVLAGFTRAGHSNPSKAYADIRAYGRNLRAGLAPNGKTLADGSPLPAGDDAAGDGANPAKRSDGLVAIEDGVKYYKRMAKSDDAKLVAYAEAFAALMKSHLNFDVRLAK